MNKVLKFIGGVADTIAKKLSHEELEVQYTPIENRVEHVVKKSPLFARINWNILPNLQDEYAQLKEYKEISREASNNCFNVCLIDEIGNRRGINLNHPHHCYEVEEELKRLNALHCINFHEMPPHMLARLPDDINTVLSFVNRKASPRLVVTKPAPQQPTPINNIKRLE